jgi:hypothetical protein
MTPDIAATLGRIAEADREIAASLDALDALLAAALERLRKEPEGEE